MIQGWRRRWFPNGEWIVLLALAGEIALFTAIARNFSTIGNFFEVTRLSVELGLLAVAMTPIVITGGIDLSVGSMMGLAAVVFGAAYRDWHIPVPGAAALALLVGCVGGSLNALLIARFNIPAIIVTLGTFSLFRGIAEGLTEGAVNYSGVSAALHRTGAGLSLGRHPRATSRARHRRGRLRCAAAPIGRRPRVVRDWFRCRGSSVRRNSRSASDRARVCPLWSDVQPCRHRICGASRSGEVGCRDRLRARCDHRGGAWRHVGIRRPRHDVGHAHRAVVAGGVAQRTAPGSVTVGAHGRPHGCIAGCDNRIRSLRTVRVAQSMYIPPGKWPHRGEAHSAPRPQRNRSTPCAGAHDRMPRWPYCARP